MKRWYCIVVYQQAPIYHCYIRTSSLQENHLKLHTYSISLAHLHMQIVFGWVIYQLWKSLCYMLIEKTLIKQWSKKLSYAYFIPS